jgi:hypothetical protein
VNATGAEIDESHKSADPDAIKTPSTRKTDSEKSPPMFVNADTDAVLAIAVQVMPDPENSEPVSSAAAQLQVGEDEPRGEAVQGGRGQQGRRGQ